jgi:hypothetical protein
LGVCNVRRIAKILDTYRPIANILGGTDVAKTGKFPTFAIRDSTTGRAVGMGYDSAYVQCPARELKAIAAAYTHVVEQVNETLLNMLVSV